MKVVLTGGTGLIGKALTERLRREGIQVTVLARPEWDGERDIAPPKVFHGCEVLVHLAGENIASQRWTNERKRHLINSRIVSAKNLKAGLTQAQVMPKLFITASATGFYGDQGDEELTESSPAGCGFLSELCQEWENAADETGCQRTVKARFGVVIGHGGFLQQVTSMFKRFGASRLGSGKQWLSWIHIEDAVQVLMLALKDQSINGALNVVAPHAVTNSQLTEELRQQFGVFRAPPVPGFALKVLYGELAELLLSSQRVVPLKLEKLGFQWRYPTLKEAVTEAIRAPS